MNTEQPGPKARAKMLVNASPSPKLVETADTIMEEMACAIAEAQAALFAGRFLDLECYAGRLQELCESLKKYPPNCESEHDESGLAIEMSSRSAAVHVYRQNKVFAAVLRRMRRHLEGLRGLLNGPSITYRAPQMIVPERKN